MCNAARNILGKTEHYDFQMHQRKEKTKLTALKLQLKEQLVRHFKCSLNIKIQDIGELKEC